MAVDSRIVENLVEVITREVLLALSEQEARNLQPGIDLCKLECANHICVSTCFDKVGQVISAGAQRISMAPGDGPLESSLASLIDHTLLKPDATPEQITRLCEEARQNNFASVCVNPINVKRCAELLRGSAVKVCSVVGFPLGATYPDIKVLEAQYVLQDGANEIDMVINIGALKAGDLELVARDIRGVVKVAHEAGALVKVIIEAALLSDQEKIIACLLAKEAGADYVKTSTGFAGGGATVHDVELMRRAVGASMGVKAAGGIKTRQDAVSMLKAGATRIGASAGVKIVRGDDDAASSSSQPKSY